MTASSLKPCWWFKEISVLFRID